MLGELWGAFWRQGVGFKSLVGSSRVSSFGSFLAAARLRIPPLILSGP